MNEHAIYFAKKDFYDVIKGVGGTWNDSKERPIVCLLKLSENDNLYWAIPMGNWNHRDNQAKARINRYLAFDKDDIRSCFYHVGRTDEMSIFFISDIVPISEKYIDRVYINRYTQKQHVIQNAALISELIRKVLRILAWENANNNYFRQHITDIKKYLLNEINEEENKEDTR